MAISFVSSAAAAGTTVAMPTHQTGDMLVAFVFRDGSTTGPTIPAGWQPKRTHPGTTCVAVLATKVATSSSETTGTWTGATGISVSVYRGVKLASTLQTNIGVSTSIGMGGDLLIDGDFAKSWVVKFAGHRTATNMTSNIPANHVMRSGVATELVAFDTNGPVGTNVTAQGASSTPAKSVNANSGWIALSCELISDDDPAPDALVDSFDSSVIDTAKWSVSTANGGSVAASSGQLVITKSGLTSRALLEPNDPSGKVAKGMWPEYKPVTVQVKAYAEVGTPSSDNCASWGISRTVPSDNYSFRWGTGGVARPYSGSTALGTTHTHVNGDWYRIRESLGTIYWEWSSDAISWTSLYSEAVFSRGGSFLFYAGYSGTSGTLTGGTFSIDNINVLPGAAPANPGQFFAAFF